MHEESALSHVVEKLVHEVRALTHVLVCDKSQNSGGQGNAVTFRDLQRLEDKLMATQAEITAQVKTLNATVKKIGVETGTLKQKVADLEAAANEQPNATEELKDAVAELVAQVTIVDDLVPDAVETTDVPATGNFST